MVQEETGFHIGYSPSVLVGNWSEERVVTNAESVSVSSKKLCEEFVCVLLEGRPFFALHAMMVACLTSASAGL